MAGDSPVMKVNRASVIAALALAMEEGIRAAQAAFEELRGSLEGESKSTAGDKHETGRAMVQMEMEQAAARLNRVEGMVRGWKAMDPNAPRDVVGPGAIVATDHGGFVIGVAWGTFQVPDATDWRGISSDAPLALALRGCQAGEAVTFRGRSWNIVEVG